MNCTYLKDVEVRKRLFWFKEVHRLGVNQACLKLGIYKSHYYYWKRRYDQFGIEGLMRLSSRPKRSPRISHKSLVRKILALREETRRGASTLALLLQSRFGMRVARSTVHHILKREGKIQKKQRPLKKKHALRYQANKPGDRIQIDVKYVPYRIPEGTYGRAYQYTAIDDCTRVRFAKIYDGHGIYQLENFLEEMKTFFPFKVKLIQTDNHVIFTYKYTAHQMAFRKQPKVHFLETFCKQHKIKHHLIEPGEPALNGKVERSHKTDEISFYQIHHHKHLSPLQQHFRLWIDYYNHQRPHWGIKGQTPVEKLKTFGYTLRRLSHEKIHYSLKIAA